VAPVGLSESILSLVHRTATSPNRCETADRRPFNGRTKVISPDEISMLVPPRVVRNRAPVRTVSSADSQATSALGSLLDVRGRPPPAAGITAGVIPGALPSRMACAGRHANEVKQRTTLLPRASPAVRAPVVSRHRAASSGCWDFSAPAGAHLFQVMPAGGSARTMETAMSYATAALVNAVGHAAAPVRQVVNAGNAERAGRVSPRRGNGGPG